jgi:hypothetical protein
MQKLKLSDNEKLIEIAFILEIRNAVIYNEDDNSTLLTPLKFVIFFCKSFILCLKNSYLAMIHINKKLIKYLLKVYFFNLISLYIRSLCSNFVFFTTFYKLT